MTEMALKVEKIALWSGEVEDKPGALARVLEPLAAAGANLEVVLAQRNPAKIGVGTVWLYPVRGRKALDAARSAGLSEAPTPAVLRVEGPDKPGLGHALAKTLAEAGINLAFAHAAVLRGRFVALFGFDSDSDANKARRILSAFKVPRRRRAKASPTFKGRTARKR
ncbi:MAG: ACT domain-containing protein [Armatimonadota bacterium]|nr:ACT domain-containing protein [Armatimonadota bacterium]MDT7972873.1 ACT domain-containing protein [Armatimonadota bacterium]